MKNTLFILLILQLFSCVKDKNTVNSSDFKKGEKRENIIVRLTQPTQFGQYSCGYLLVPISNQETYQNTFLKSTFLPDSITLDNNNLNKKYIINFTFTGDIFECIDGNADYIKDPKELILPYELIEITSLKPY